MVLLCRMLVLSTPLPPPDLMLLVTGNADSTQWAASRRLAVEDIQGQLKALDIQLGRDAEILDLGCGCGRLLAGWEGLLPDTAILHGVDINPQLVAFCQDNIPFASVSCCNYDPPLSFDRAKFDLVYCASVFTHVTLPASPDGPPNLPGSLNREARLSFPTMENTISIPCADWRPTVKNASARWLLYVLARRGRANISGIELLCVVHDNRFRIRSFQRICSFASASAD